MRLYFQGDICLEEIADLPVSGEILAPARDGALVLAEGESTGHRHAIFDAGVTFFRDDGLAGGIPPALYVGHLKVESGGASLQHDEHDTIVLPAGTYRVRRQREFDERTIWGRTDGRVVAD